MSRVVGWFMTSVTSEPGGGVVHDQCDCGRNVPRRRECPGPARLLARRRPAPLWSKGYLQRRRKTHGENHEHVDALGTDKEKCTFPEMLLL